MDICLADQICPAVLLLTDFFFKPLNNNVVGFVPKAMR